MKTLLRYSLIVLCCLSPSGVSADLESEYQYGERSRQSATERCNRLKRLGNYTREGGGSWDVDYYVDGNTVYERNRTGNCEYEWSKIATLDSQVNTRIADMDKSTGYCTVSILFKKKGTDLISYKKSDCNLAGPGPGFEKLCYVPINWESGSRKYPYCGCFDNPIPGWMASSGYCKNASSSGFGGLFNGLFR